MELRISTMLTLVDAPLEEIPCEYHDAMQAVWSVLATLPPLTFHVYSLLKGIRRRGAGYEPCAPHGVMYVADQLNLNEQQVWYHAGKVRKWLCDAILDARILDEHAYRTGDRTRRRRRAFRCE